MMLAIRSPGFLSPSISAFLFENHYLWWIGLVVVGSVLILVARKRIDKRLLLAGQALLILTILWGLAARLMDTPAERLHDAHVALGKAAEKHDVDAILGFAEKDLALQFSEISPNLEEARKQIKGYLDALNIKDTTFTRYEVSFKPDGSAVVDFVAITRYDGGAMQTTWRVIWVDVPGEDWRIHTANGHFTKQ